MRLQERVAIVTGAARGIGRTYALGLAREGAAVVVADILDGTETVGSIEQEGGSGLYVRTDVSDESSVRSMVERTAAEFGGVDILINNAAVFVALYPLKDFDKIPVEEWDKVMSVNLRGVFLCCKAVVPHMRAKGRGRIINISSQVAWNGLPGFMHYVTSKAGVIGLTRAVAREVGAQGITVNAIAPGYTQSEAVIGVQDAGLAQDPSHVAARQAIPRPEVPEDLVGAILFLASDDSAFITGQTLVVDGGLILH